MKQRIRALRKHFKLTQEEFGTRIGVSRDSVATYEGGRVIPPEAVIKLIMREFNVDYGWLKDGVGEMFSSDEDEFQAAIDDLMTGENEAAKSLLRGLSKLSDKQWEALDEILAVLEKERGH